MNPDHTANDIARFVADFVTAVDFQDPIAVTGETMLDDLPEWDSLAALGVILMCDANYGVPITGDDLKACRSVADIYSRVACRKAA